MNAGAQNVFSYRRPERHPWAQLRPEIEQLLNEGWGLYRLGKRYGMTGAGMRGVLMRLGLKTHNQKLAESAL